MKAKPLPRWLRLDAQMLALLVITLAALALRLWGLGSESIWLDEATSIVLAKMSLPELVQWTAVDIHPPLYYVLLHGWLVVGDAEWQVRLLSVVFGVGAVAFLYLLTRRLFDGTVALVAAALLAFSPLHVWYSQETRMYAMLACLAVLSSYLMLRALLDGRRWAWAAYVITAIAAVYTHYYAFFVLLFQNVAAMYLVWSIASRGRAPDQGLDPLGGRPAEASSPLAREMGLEPLGGHPAEPSSPLAGETGLEPLGSRPPEASSPLTREMGHEPSGGRLAEVFSPVRRVLGCWLLAQALVALAFLPWLPVLINQVRGGGGSWVARAGVPGLEALVATAVSFSLGPDLSVYVPLLRRFAYLIYGFLLILAAAQVVKRSPRRWAIVFSLLYVLVPLLTAWTLSQVKPMYSQRYLLPFLPAYYILTAYGLDQAGRLAARHGLRLSRLLPALLLAGLMALGAVGIAGSATRLQSADWRGVVAFVLERAQPGDAVVFVPGWNAKPFDYYARGRISLVKDTPIPLRAEDVPVVVADAAQGRSRLWIVQAVGHYADPDNLLGSYVDSTFRPQEQRRFRGNILVSLYDGLKP